MTDHSAEVDVVLQGGPTDLQGELRIALSPDTREKIKVPLYGGTEHFEFIGDPSSNTTPRVYRWTMRTRIAE